MATTSLSLVATPVAAQSSAAERVQDFDIPAGDLATALRSFGRQARMEVIFSAQSLRGLRTAGVSGRLSAGEALQRLVAGSGAKLVRDASGAYLVQADESVDIGDRTTATDSDPARTTIVVTGTNIRGIAPESSPVQSYGREEIQQSGATTTEQFIRTLPQNFGGGSSEFAPGGLPNDVNSEANALKGTGANLRGLGSGATLVLLDGHRLAPSSSIGDFVDLSMIPVSALERVDVLTDGASSIYGGDAVGGVINFVLRDDFEGAEASLRYGAASNGGADEWRASFTSGAAWSDGNILGTFEFYDRGNLTLADRPEILAPEFSGGGLITARDSFDLLPQQTRRSALLSIKQEISPTLLVSASGLYSKRDVESSAVNNIGSGLIINSDSYSETLAANWGVEYEISPSVSISSSMTFNKLNGRSDSIGYVYPGTEVDTTSSNEYSSDLWGVDLVLRADIFHLPGGTVGFAAGAHFRQEDFLAESATLGVVRGAERDVAAAFGELFIPFVGSVNASPGMRRLEVSLSARLDDYSDFGTTVNPKIGVLWAPTDGLRFRGSYSTSFAPPPLGRVGDPGIIGRGIPTSVLAGLVGVDIGQYPTLDGTNMLLVAGTSRDLDPETSQTFTIGSDFEADWTDGKFSANATYYNVNFQGRLGQTPMPGNVFRELAPFIALDTPGAFPDGTVSFFPSEDEIATVVETVFEPIRFLAGGSLENVGVINYASVTRNLAVTKTSGLDFNIDTEFYTEIGAVNIGLNANYIFDFEQKAASTSPAVSVLNTLYSPTDIRLRAHLGFSGERFSMNTFVNYIPSYQTDSTQAAIPIDSWTTIDLFLSYELGDASRRWLDGTTLSLSVTNVFDEAPPYVPPLGQFELSGYDPANASPVGRFIAFEIRKTF
ncbi:TonB-dependent receptor [Pelagerythrobacter aerophilus]|nr:TonB-dependent receptor [Pelagerythrobacter aerophilus]